MAEKKYYAHSLNEKPESEWHEIEKHLAETAEKARSFAENFDSGGWADLAGGWHDLGKYSEDFQNMIRSENGQNAHIEAVKTKRVIHSTGGALYALQKYGAKKGLPLAFVISGHHGGLTDKEDLKSRLDAQTALLDKALAAEIPEEIFSVKTLAPPAFLINKQTPEAKSRSQEFWIRMLYSALVDADFLDTEEFYDRQDDGFKVKTRSAGNDLSELKAEFDRYMADKSLSCEDIGVNRIRAEILKSCREKALSPQGVFRLTAPTGAGKTLAAMAFALEHTLKHKLERIIVVIPFTSVIEQNAKVYREAFGKLGEDNLVEHHASLDPEKEDYRNRLACENWDARVIVTTSVQFFESLLANRSSRCRKLHNIPKSIVIFDEVQSLPIGHLTPILDLLKELVSSYKVSIVLSTATQPALGQRPAAMGMKFPGFEQITEIVPNPEKTFEILKRAEIVWPEKTDESCSWEDLAKKIQKHEKVLAIVHRRDDARTLTRLLPENTFHLSRLMCAAHRLQVLEEIRNALKDESIETVRVVSTQLVEAGVDLDFPAVYRAFGGLDAVAQAAGRCNREGKAEKGKVHIFVPPTRPPRGTPSAAYDVADTMLRAKPDIDPLSPDIFESYFRQLYLTKELDAKGIQRDRTAFKFKTVAQNFNMIEDDGSEAVIVPFGEAEKRLDDLRKKRHARGALRSLQPFVVNLYPNEIRLLENAGAFDPTIKDTVKVILPTHAYLYDKVLGLVIEGHLAADPASLQV